MIYMNKDTGQFVPFALRATFYDRDTLRVKYDNTEKYWREFVKKWWHHSGLKFEPLVLTAEQQARLDEVNAQEIPAMFETEVAIYVEFGYVEPESQCPYLSTKAGSPENQEARLEHLRQQKRAELAARRFKVETGGLDIGGVIILTDRESQAQLTSAYYTLKEGLAVYVDWKSATGWVSVDLTDITPIARAVTGHVQSCFTAERRVDEEMTQLVDYDELAEFDVVTAFDVKLLDVKAELSAE